MCWRLLLITHCVFLQHPQFSVAIGIPFACLLFKVRLWPVGRALLLGAWLCVQRAAVGNLRCGSKPWCIPTWSASAESLEAARDAVSPLPMQGMPMSVTTGSVALYATVLLVFALLKAWPAPACNNPLFAGEAGGVAWLCWVGAFLFRLAHAQAGHPAASPQRSARSAALFTAGVIQVTCVCLLTSFT